MQETHPLRAVSYTHLDVYKRQVKALAPDELAELCREIRATLLAYGHQHGGHIGSNLGMVEATVALHRVFDSPRDRIVLMYPTKATCISCLLYTSTSVLAHSPVSVCDFSRAYCCR